MGAEAAALIVDDDPAMRDSLRFALQVEGLRVRVFRDVAALLADPFLADANLGGAGCLLISDRLPAMDWGHLARQLAAARPGVSVILIAGHATARLRQRAREAGVRLVVEKPLTEDGLSQIIHVLKEGCGRST